MCVVCVCIGRIRRDISWHFDQFHINSAHFSILNTHSTTPRGSTRTFSPRSSIMSRRNNNQLPNNLPQLQNLIKRDPESYKEEFSQQYAHFQASMQLFRLNPNEYNKELDELLMFLAQVSLCYQTDLSTYPQELVDTLEKFGSVLEPEMRMTMCRALVLLRNKNLLEPTALLSLFFKLLHCQDKNLRKFLETRIITDIKNVNSKHKNVKLNTVLQNFMFVMIKDSNTRAAKMSLNIMIDLYRKNIWDDVKTVNVIANACFTKITKIMVTAIQFFLTNQKSVKSDDEDSDDDMPNAKEIIMANRVNKKTRKRDKNLAKAKTIIKKKKKKTKAPTFNFSALHLIHDPQGFAEKLFKQLESLNERFEVKLMTLDLISRLIGIHKLILLNFYPYAKRFLQPHQREVTQILQFVSQATHDLVPPDAMEGVIQAIVNNFVSEHNAGEVMAVGLNALREICARSPLVMTKDLLQDLAQFKTYKEKSVMMAARSIIHLFRDVNPDFLHKKDKGRPTLAGEERNYREFGAIEANEFIPGAEALLDDEGSVDSDSHSMDEDSEDESGDDEWVNVSHSEDEEVVDQEQEKTLLTAEERRAKASEVSLSKILTDEDFKKIDALQLQKQLAPLKKGSAKKRKASTANDTNNMAEVGDLVDLKSIENVHKKRKHDYESRLETVMKGREGREKFNQKKGRMNPHASTTDKEKKKKKNFMMVRHKLKKQKKKSFKEKQSALRKSLLKQKKNN